VLSARETPRGESSAIMKKTLTTKAKVKQPDELAPEYRFDTGGQNRTDSLSGHGRNHCNSSGADVAQVFETGDRVNAVLRALMQTMPPGRGSSHR